MARAKVTQLDCVKRQRRFGDLLYSKSDAETIIIHDPQSQKSRESSVSPEGRWRGCDMQLTNCVRAFGVWYMVKGSADQRRRQRISGHINQINEIEDSSQSKRGKTVDSKKVGGPGVTGGRLMTFCGWPNVFIVMAFGYQHWQKAKQNPNKM